MGITTGREEIDSAGGIPEAAVSLLVAGPGQGKTVWAAGIAERALADGLSVAVLTGDETERDWRDHIVSGRAGVDLEEYLKGMGKVQAKRKLLPGVRERLTAESERMLSEREALASQSLHFADPGTGNGGLAGVFGGLAYDLVIADASIRSDDAAAVSLLSGLAAATGAAVLATASPVDPDGVPADPYGSRGSLGVGGDVAMVVAVSFGGPTEVSVR